jgi:hypothetical protein
MKKYCCFILVFLATGFLSSLFAQYDSSYIRSYDGYLVGRFLLNRKYTALNVSNDIGNYRVRYRPNKTFSVGLGVTYKLVTVNVSVGLVQPNEEKGKTRDFDLQLYRYGRKFVTDVIFQFYKGFYIPDGRYAPALGSFYVRPDIKMNTIGGSYQYILNHRKFSYRAAFQQTELQKKSAGSVTIGFELFMGRFAGDSTVIPHSLIDETGESIYKMKFIELGPNLGYVHTWVYHKFFLSAGGSVSLNAGVHKYFDAGRETVYTAVSPNSLLRFSGGYNTERWGLNLLFRSADLHLPDFENRSILFSAGNLRMNFIYRFLPNKSTRKLLRGIDRVHKKLKG